MQLEGIHHISSITADAARNVDFYVRVLGLRMVKKTVNQDDPSVYHLFYADEQGSPGADLTFFEYPGARAGRAGAGMIHTIVLRVGAEASLDFWRLRLADEQVDSERGERSLRFADPEGLGYELIVDESGDAPLAAQSPDVPAEHAIRGFAGVRAYSADPARSASLLRETLGFRADDDADAWEARGARRGGFYAYDAAPEQRGIGGAGTVHHVAWAAYDAEIEAWDERVRAAGSHTSGLVDRYWFRSVYFREPSGVLFELATLGPGFTADEPLETLGQSLVLPPRFESQRAQIEANLTPLPPTRPATVS
ncbi:ring-cleaving dioxygenase [Conexibacter sp. JD483]|uniref:ring-cleaving dioxygenase n=1 Tax=unclassified Conexibacter TaxID=2627773 RepID=UPI00272450B2|nr:MULTISPECIES: ring-cleaving dioxygenase [unclassified Conexibacter]MDO8188397.1 ring-cleaving dioxygenase [Conexibacter sp. CPCC 205706]MDO8198184.1 ring-cleaving dioxygenase [Conexibacter sp. CPCC 205762]MDR9370680.1 ring-cleaving dioxygenase [Conexibacter sp. JD483]